MQLPTPLPPTPYPPPFPTKTPHHSFSYVPAGVVNG